LGLLLLMAALAADGQRLNGGWRLGLGPGLQGTSSRRVHGQTLLAMQIGGLDWTRELLDNDYILPSTTIL
jgi:hypothetical protein